MSEDKKNVEFDCPWCGNYQNKKVYKSAETEILCISCKKLIGLLTDENGKPIRIGTKVHLATANTQDSEAAETKLGKTEVSIEKARKEAERRGLVVESKMYGAAIEIIDRLRDQLKQQDVIVNEIKELRTELEKMKAQNQVIKNEYLNVLKQLVKGRETT